MGGLYTHTTRAPGTILTAAIYNTDHQNHIDNLIPSMIDDQSANLAAMQSQVDPYPGGAASLSTSLAGELERIRYQLAQIQGTTNWYEDNKGRGWDLIEDRTISVAVAQSDFESGFTSAYGDHEFVFELFDSANDMNLYGRMKAGGAYLAGASYEYHASTLASNAAAYSSANASAANQFLLGAISASASSPAGTTGILRILNPLSAQQKRFMWSTIAKSNAGSITYFVNGGGGVDTSSALQGFRFFFSGGTIIGRVRQFARRI